MRNNKGIPAIILCAGMPRSKSTWLYNVALKLANRGAKARGIYADTPAELEAEIASAGGGDEVLVVKCHAPTAELVAFTRFLGGVAITSIRDPRDCAASLVETFGFSGADAVDAITRSIKALDRLNGPLPLLSYRYETERDDLHIVHEIAGLIGIALDDATACGIVADLSPAKVSQLVEAAAAAGTIDPQRPAETWTEQTHWHPSHIGDGLTGKFLRALTEVQAFTLSQTNRTFMDRHGYAPTPRPPVSGPAVLPIPGKREVYLDGGFSHVEDWGVWTDGPAARLSLPLVPDAAISQLALHLILGPSLVDGQATGQIQLNGRTIARLPFVGGSADVFLVANLEPQPASGIVIDFELGGLLSPQGMGINEDTRMLGLALRSIHCLSAEHGEDQAAASEEPGIPEALVETAMR